MVSNFILASGSPRRKDLLSLFEIPFQVRTFQGVEDCAEQNPKERAGVLAKLKGEGVWKSLSDSERANSLLLASDTLGQVQERALERPKNLDEAKEMLLSLENKWHHIFTSLYFVWTEEGREKKISHTVETRVKMGAMNPELLSFYLNQKHSLDRAGSYGAQDLAQAFIERIEGSYSAVVGLPLFEVNQILEQNFGQSWRTLFLKNEEKA